jgi:hypothetical protein
MVLRFSEIRRNICTDAKIRREEKKMQDVKKGDIAVTENGDVVVITRADVQADDTDSFGRIHIFHVGTYLRSNTLAVGSRWNGLLRASPVVPKNKK